MEPLFVDKDKLPIGASLVGRIEASEAIVDILGAGREPLTLLHTRVRNEVIKKVGEEHGTDQQFYLVSTSYDIKDDIGGTTGHAACDVYKV